MERVQQDAHRKEGTQGHFGRRMLCVTVGTDTWWSSLEMVLFCCLQIIKDGEEHADLNEVAKLFNIHED